MPFFYRTTFPVRSYECDAYGHVNQSNYLRYMQEAAIEASAASGYSEAHYAELGSLFLIRATEITYHNALKYGDTLYITTWIESIRRVVARRAYELRRAHDNALAATAYSDWVYLDSATERPRSMPDDLITAFSPTEGEVMPTAPERARFVAPPSAPTAAFTMTRVVEWRDIDRARHVNNAVYLSYMEESSVQAAAHFGWPIARMTAENFAIVARQHHLEYLGQAVLGETLRVTTYLFDVKRSTLNRYFEVARVSDNTVLARSRSLFMCLNLANETLGRVPQAALADFAGHIAE